MAPISDAWPNAKAALEFHSPDFVDRVASLVKWFLPHFLDVELYATSLHPRNKKCRIVQDNYTWGRSFVVFEIVFVGAADNGPQDEEESWIIRFAMPPIGDSFNTPAQLERKIMNEAAALQLVRTRTTIPVPHIIASHPVAGGSQPTEYQHSHGPHPLGPDFPAFVLMTAIRGFTIEDCGIAIHELGQADPDSDPLKGDEMKRPILKQYLRDIADIHVQLSRITFDKIGGFVMDDEGNVAVGPSADFGLGPFETAKEYFTVQAEAYENLAELLSEQNVEEGGIDGEDDEERSAEYLKRRFVASLWRTAIMPLVDERDAGGPFPMRHGDLHSENILVDRTGHIIGVLDWDCAATVPWEAFAVPTFEVSGHFGESKNESIIHDLAAITSSLTISGTVTQEAKQESVFDPDGNETQSEMTDSASDPNPGTSAQLLRRGHKRDRSRPQVHEEFNRALIEVELESSAQSPKLSVASLPPDLVELSREPPQPPPVTASGRSLAALHDSDAGYVGAYLAYWMYSLACDYEETGRVLHRMLVTRGSQNKSQSLKENGVDGGRSADWELEGDMEEAFRKFVSQVRGETNIAV